MKAIGDLLRENRVHCDSQLWNVVIGLAEIMAEQGDPVALERRERAKRRVDALRAKADSTVYPAEALLCRAKADELAAHVRAGMNPAAPTGSRGCCCGGAAAASSDRRR